MAKRSNKRPAAFGVLYARLNPAKRRRVNEAVIEAVNACTDMNGTGPIGTKAFLESRAQKLIVEMQKIGWSTASKRFKSAVSRWAKNHAISPLQSDIPKGEKDPDFSQQFQCQKMPILQVQDLHPVPARR